MKQQKLRLALLDMNNGTPNQGMRCLREIVDGYKDQLDWDEFDVRQKNELPDLSYDIYLSSGGPGSPLDGDEWKKNYFDFVQSAWLHNQKEGVRKKYIFFICHSFQLACEHFKLGTIAQRKSTSFGVYPMHKNKAGRKEPLFDGLSDPYYAVDSRDWQLIQPNLKVFAEHGSKVLSLEKIRTHVEYERAIMAVRFSPELFGTQFHPEADAIGMKIHFEKVENREKVIKNFGEERYNAMMDMLDDPDKIASTHSIILPGFIESSIQKIKEQEIAVL